MAMATSDSVVASRKLSLAFVALLSLCTSVQAETNFTLWVSRRSSTDVYGLKSNTMYTDTVNQQCGDKPNYLVNEKLCASDEELFSSMYAHPMISVVYNHYNIIYNIIGCRVAIVPINSIFLIPTVVIDGQYSAIITLDDVEIFGFSGTNQTANSSFCNISSLEMYRGRQQVIEVSHQGFSLGDDGSIEVR